jgi:DNA repair and recombination protein RAD54B
VGGKEIEVESMISKADFMAGRPFLGNTKQPAPQLKDIDGVSRVSAKSQQKFKKLHETQRDIAPSVPASQASKSAFKTPFKERSTVLAPNRASKVPVPRHDPNAENALVMKRPASVPKGKQIVDVVVDPLLTKSLREHQRNGVAFLYECVMGMRGSAGEGAILADEMGLGKTLQTIALLWTLMKQSPIDGDGPVVKKALIVCPVTLINNWRKEIRKWLGNERLGVFVADNKHTRLTDFTKGRAYSIMIIGYEKLRNVQEDLQKGSGIDIVIADEGHRLKTAQNKSAAAIKTLNTERRVILSGTPIQNDLAEFHTMVDFVNPGLLEKYTAFKRTFELPILKSQQPGATAKELELGEARSEELANITGKFILRRTAEILSKYLPQKTEHVVFCRPTAAQASVYRAIIGSPTFNAALGSPAVTLELITILKKVCNSPTLLLKKDDKGEETVKPALLESVPSNLLKSMNPGMSGKVQVLDRLLHQISSTTDEKVVLVSNYTSTLDVLQSLLASMDYTFLRLDGSTPASKRQDLVDRFNRSPPSNAFVFLLSAKAGGVGLNLIGASRLVLFDLDWNPATDIQAMARIHRDGQKRPCYIYRMLTQGAMDEKIFQRQASKTGLADSIVDGKSGASGFTKEELRDLFTFDEREECQTHELLGCECGGSGTPLPPPEDVDDLPPRNDLAALSDSIKADTEKEEDDDDDDEDDIPLRPKLRYQTSATVNMQDQEAEILRKKKELKDSGGKAKMVSLMQYTHIDPAVVSRTPTRNPTPAGDEDEAEPSAAGFSPMEVAVEDAILRSVMEEEGSRIRYLFSKASS